MDKKWGIAAAILAVVLVVGGFIFAPQLRAIKNNKDFAVQKVDDATNYQKIKAVEDSCRSMIASYQADKSTYEQYKNSTDAQEKNWAGEAKMRANRTVATYNSYILQNSFVWKGNIPSDINNKLEEIK